VDAQSGVSVGEENKALDTRSRPSSSASRRRDGLVTRSKVYIFASRGKEKNHYSDRPQVSHLAPSSLSYFATTPSSPGAGRLEERPVDKS